MPIPVQFQLGTMTMFCTKFHIALSINSALLRRRTLHLIRDEFSTNDTMPPGYGRRLGPGYNERSIGRFQTDVPPRWLPCCPVCGRPEPTCRTVLTPLIPESSDESQGRGPRRLLSAWITRRGNPEWSLSQGIVALGVTGH
jgi:hypothetical protein